MSDNFGAPQDQPDQTPGANGDGSPSSPVASTHAGTPTTAHEYLANEPAPRGNRRATWAIAAAIVSVLVVVGAATVVIVMNHRADVAAAERVEAAERKEAAEEKAAEEAQQAVEEAAAAELAAAESHFDSCLDQINPLFNALQKVDARLDVGLNQSDLSNMVGDASVAYSRIDIAELGTGTCLTIGVRLERAFNAYAGTVSDWNDCIYDYGCDNDAITPSLQRKWADASRAIDKASGLVDSLDPHSSSFDPDTASEVA